MSCHDIGRGIDAIMEKVLEMYDEGKIFKEAALEMVKVFPKAVNWCDGNEYEAQETLTATHCAACLKKYRYEEDRIVYDDLDLAKEDIAKEFERDWWFTEMKKAGFNGRSVCRSCFQKIFAHCFTESGRKKLGIGND